MIETSLSHSEPVALPDRSTGPVVRSIAVHALMVAVMGASQILLVFVPAAVFHCAIRNGRRSAAWAAGIAGVALYALLTGAQPRPEHLALIDVAFLGFAVVLPSLVALPLVERGEPFGRVLMVLLLGSILGLVATEIGFRSFLDVSPYQATVAEIQREHAQVLTLYKEKGFTVDDFQQGFARSLAFLPGVLIAFLSLVYTLSLLMLGRLKAWSDHAASRGNEIFGAYLLRNLALPEWVLFAFLVGGLTPLTNGLVQTIAANTLIVVAILYLVQGFAVFRGVLGGAGLTGPAAMLSWLVLLFLMVTGVGFLLLAMAGLFDPFFDFRHFKKRKDDSHESHSD